MPWRNKEDLGTTLVAHIHDQLKIGDKYLLDVGRGFTWWAGDFSQTVVSDHGLFHNASTLYRLHIETEVVKAHGHAREILPQIATLLGQQCSLSAITYHEDSDTFRMHCSVYANYECEEWLRKVLLAATSLQLSEAKLFGAALAQHKGITLAISSHPNAGMREQPDPLTEVESRFIVPAGAGPSRWVGCNEWEEARDNMKRISLKVSTDGATCIEGEFEFVGNSAPIRLSISAEDRHPRLGSGLQCLLTIPSGGGPDVLSAITESLNESERREWNWCHDLGAWCIRGEVLCFECFVPNIAFSPQILLDLSHDMALRAKWLNETWAAGTA